MTLVDLQDAKERSVEMNEEIKELIAIGSSVTAHCQPCLTYHIGKAKKLGIEEGRIREAITVGRMVEKGSMSAMRQFAEGIFDASAVTGGCCGNEKSKGHNCCA